MFQIPCCPGAFPLLCGAGGGEVHQHQRRPRRRHGGLPRGDGHQRETGEERAETNRQRGEALSTPEFEGEDRPRRQ